MDTFQFALCIPSFFFIFLFFIPHNILIIGENLMRFPGLKIISMLC